MVSKSDGTKDAESEFSSAQEALSVSESKIKQLAAELAELHDAYDSRNARTMILEGELFKIRTEQKRLSEERDRISRDLEEARSDLEVERRSRTASADQIKALEGRLAEQSDEVERLRQQTRSLESQLSEHLIEQQLLSSDRDRIGLKLQEAESALEAERLSCAAGAEQIETLQRQLAGRTDEVARLRQQVGNLEKEILNHLDQQQLLSSDRDRLASELEQVRSSLQTELVLRDADAEMIAALNNELGERTDEIQRLHAEVRIRFEELAIVTSLAEKVDNALQKTRDMLRSKTARVATLEVELAGALRATETAQIEVEKNATLLASREKDLADARRSTKAAQLEARELDRRIAEILGSASWKMTKPVRRLSRIASRWQSK